MANLEDQTGYEGGFTWSLGEAIRRMREKRGMSRTGLAKLTGISPNSMVKYEMAGQPDGKYPSLLNAAKISMALSLDPRWMFEMLFRAGEIKTDGDLASITFKSFVNHFKDEEMERNLNGLRFQQLDDMHTQEHILEQLKQLSEKVDELSAKIEKKNGPDG
ncbi:helix-turn-helix transcriptional regulator [Thalassospira lucentensis]|uniref:helix-turn-helix transcriptional regulator n=1 Tax=Thalassospira lucentensis TaxID=168935 RepID=UPI003AA82087